MQQETVLTLSKGGELLAIVRHDMESRHQVFYKVTEMGSDEIKDLYSDMDTGGSDVTPRHFASVRTDADIFDKDEEKIN